MEPIAPPPSSRHRPTSLATLSLIVFVVAVTALVAALPRRQVSGPTIALFRVLVPSWRFFDDVQRVPALLARVAPADGDFGPWVPLLGSVRRTALALVFNPQGNLRLAQYALLDRLLMDVGDDATRDGEAVERLVSYELVRNLVEVTLRERGVLGAGDRFQFTLLEWEDGGGGPPAPTLLTSAEHRS